MEIDISLHVAEQGRGVLDLVDDHRWGVSIEEITTRLLSLFCNHRDIERDICVIGERLDQEAGFAGLATARQNYCRTGGGRFGKRCVKFSGNSHFGVFCNLIGDLFTVLVPTTTHRRQTSDHTSLFFKQIVIESRSSMSPLRPAATSQNPFGTCQLW
jgi:hypothetical protein